jgi:hypothetical protein
MTDQPPVAFCWHCGNPNIPGHACDGQQGRVEAAAPEAGDPDLPLLISGLTEETYATSAAAAVSVEDSKASQRALVEHTFNEGGPSGHTDDEVQALLDLDGSSERPRRWELWKLGRLEVLRDSEGRPIKRLTRTRRWAVVWITSAFAPARAWPSEAAQEQGPEL